LGSGGQDMLLQAVLVARRRERIRALALILIIFIQNFKKFAKNFWFLFILHLDKYKDE
jgi:hypothetical protein